MNMGRDEFLFLESQERRGCFLLSLREDVRELTRLVREWQVSEVDKLKSRQHGGLMID